jgi:hypothetical protein
MTVLAAHWIDEHPARYRPIGDGDYVCMRGIDERTHFIRVVLARGAIVPYPATACGIPMPPDWERHQTNFPIAGVVDCPRCLAEYQETGR